jgi:hypothetical protein
MAGSLWWMVLLFSTACANDASKRVSRGALLPSRPRSHRASHVDPGPPEQIRTNGASKKTHNAHASRDVDELAATTGLRESTSVNPTPVMHAHATAKLALKQFDIEAPARFETPSEALASALAAHRAAETIVSARARAQPGPVKPFIGVSYLPLGNVQQVSRFRSAIGHDFSDVDEHCRSMKHYHVPLNDVPMPFVRN